MKGLQTQVFCFLEWLRSRDLSKGEGNETRECLALVRFDDLEEGAVLVGNRPAARAYAWPGWTACGSSA
jgi:hypothetical protein